MGCYKKKIEKVIKSSQLDDFPHCLICYEKITTQVAYCRMCTFISCRDYFVKLLKRGKGVYVCPQCKYTIDKRNNFFKQPESSDLRTGPENTVPSYIGLALPLF